MNRRIKRIAIDPTETPTIACFNRSRIGLGVDFDDLIKALQVYIDKHVAPVWGRPARLKKTRGFIKGAWALVFLDDQGPRDDPDALAIHDLTPGGMPLAKVFVRTVVCNADLVSVAASHELVEMLVDPAINLMVAGPNPRVGYAYEIADPVAETNFPVRGIPMSNFVYPAYFEDFRKARSTRFDHMGLVTRPFQVLRDGYQTIYRNGKWTDRFGTKLKTRRTAPCGCDSRGQMRRRRRRLRRSEPRRTRMR